MKIKPIPCPPLEKAEKLIRFLNRKTDLQIYQLFRRLGIKGNNSNKSCPVSNYIRKYTKLTVFTSNEGIQIYRPPAYTVSSGYIIKVGVSHFISYFDNGCFPDLIDNDPN